jgi:tRNA nucleotidyltransferase (CCA-adding enzyme)
MNLKALYNRLSERIKDTLFQFFQIGKELGVKIYLVGGPVRDLLLNREVIDIDLVVNKNLDILVEKLERKFSFKIERTQFLTAKLNMNDLAVDIAQARKEYYPRPGALPVVSPANLRADAFRRDITINALYLEINGWSFSKLVDYVNGAEDLRKKIIRIVKKNSFWEDPTRIIRVIRYEQRFGFEMEKETLTLLKMAIKDGVFSTITPQRLGAEFIRTLKEDKVLPPLVRMDELCGFYFLSPDINLTSEKIKTLKRWDTCRYKNRILYPEIIPVMILLSDLKITEVEKISQILELTRWERSLIKNYISLDRGKILSSLSKKLSIPRIYDKLSNLDFEVVLCLYLSATGEARKNLDLYVSRISELEIEIDGEEIKKLGVSEGPQIGQLLEKLKRAKFEGKIKTRQQEIRYLQKILRCG